jgi:hypothetical protein
MRRIDDRRHKLAVGPDPHRLSAKHDGNRCSPKELRQLHTIDPMTAVTPQIDERLPPGGDVTGRQAESTRRLGARRTAEQNKRYRSSNRSFNNPSHRYLPDACSDNNLDSGANAS